MPSIKYNVTNKKWIMNYLPLLILGYLILSNKNSSYKDILKSLTEEEISMLLGYLGIDESNCSAISQAIPTLLNDDINIQKLLQMCLPLISGFFSKKKYNFTEENDFKNDNLSAISEIANNEIYEQLKSYFNW